MLSSYFVFVPIARPAVISVRWTYVCVSHISKSSADLSYDEPMFCVILLFVILVSFLCMCLKQLMRWSTVWLWHSPLDTDRL